MAILTKGSGTKKGGAVAIICDVADLPDLISRDGVPSHNERHFDNIGHFESSGSEWYGGLESIDDAKNLILQGWADGATKASNATSQGGMISSLTQPESIRRRPIWAADGDEINVDRALRGEWDSAFRTMSKVRTYGSKIVTLVSSFGGNCGRSAEELFWSGAQMLVAGELLEMAGYQTEMRGIHFNDWHHGAGDGGTHRLTLDINVKNAGDPLRLDTIASVFAHAGVFRTYGFMAICRAPWDATSSLGHSLEGHNAKVMFDDYVAKGLAEPADVFMPPAYNKEQAVKNIIAAVTQVTAGHLDPEAAV